MLLFLFLLVSIVAAALSAQFLLQGSGYLLLVFPNGLTSVEMSFWTGLGVLLIVLLVSFWLFRFLGWLSHPLQSFKQQHRRHQTQKALKTTLRGLVDLTEGRWKRARKSLKQSATHSGVPLVNYLAAAQAAHYEGLHEEAETFLKKAEQVAPEAQLAVAFSQVRFQLDQGHYEQALALLIPLYKQAPQHPVVLKQLREVHLALADWQPLMALLPDFRRMKIASETELTQLEEKVYCAYLQTYRKTQPPQDRLATQPAEASALPEALTHFWEQLPQVWRDHASIVRLWLDLLMDYQQYSQAQRLLKQYLSHHWSPDLVAYYGQLPMEEAATARLTEAEAWLQAHPQDPALLHALARLSQQAQQWQKAVDYYQASWKLQASGSVALELSYLLQALNQQALSSQYEREALQLFSQQLPLLPLPKPDAPLPTVSEPVQLKKKKP